jgi:hypothetical protein
VLVSADAAEACRQLEDSLAELLGCTVRVRSKGRAARVELAFGELAEVRDLVRRLSGRIAA